MARVRSLEGREAGILAGIIQGVFRLALGRSLNPTKVQAHAPRDARFVPVQHDLWLRTVGRRPEPGPDGPHPRSGP